MEQLKIEIQNRYKKLLLNKKEASRELGISISTLDRLRKSGYLREKRIGGGVFFTLDEIVDFIGGAN
ncbi:helix-turn-helix domain-containing protein [Aliarcobacter cryaerophilus]|jgi:predicted site-specific integrase-resolvase|uniref:helix-turn-helix domain-containing protein n=1 Tax=Aliarcobacter cryaerophilus TaxID=28198 RepID=UPI0021B5D328|nr:helix-turn-helix domain-containing protein [Aliarcobacter cryaerophilus]MCT7531220.1 helix-turn-helix domain-containing protein [Aliarcobacter cryaerophilus]